MADTDQKRRDGIDGRRRDARRLRALIAALTADLETLQGRPATATELSLIGAAASLTLQREKLMAAALATGAPAVNLVEVSGGLLRVLRELGLSGRDSHGRLIQRNMPLREGWAAEVAELLEVPQS